MITDSGDEITPFDDDFDRIDEDNLPLGVYVSGRTVGTSDQQAGALLGCALAADRLEEINTDPDAYFWIAEAVEALTLRGAGGARADVTAEPTAPKPHCNESTHIAAAMAAIIIAQLGLGGHAALAWDRVAASGYAWSTSVAEWADGILDETIPRISADNAAGLIELQAALSTSDGIPSGHMFPDWESAMKLPAYEIVLQCARGASLIPTEWWERSTLAETEYAEAILMALGGIDPLGASIETVHRLDGGRGAVAPIRHKHDEGVYFGTVDQVVAIPDEVELLIFLAPPPTPLIPARIQRSTPFPWLFDRTYSPASWPNRAEPEYAAGLAHQVAKQIHGTPSKRVQFSEPHASNALNVVANLISWYRSYDWPVMVLGDEDSANLAGVWRAYSARLKEKAFQLSTQPPGFRSELDGCYVIEQYDPDPRTSKADPVPALDDLYAAMYSRRARVA